MSQSITDIKSIYKSLKIDEIQGFISSYKDDERQGVKNLIKSGQKQIKAYESEIERTKAMQVFENKYREYMYVAGIDEVGRGPLSGPVVCGAVVLPKDCDILYINDSKKLTEAKREELYDIIYEKALGVGIGVVNPHIIDDINILNATKMAMIEAVENLEVKPNVLLIDALSLPLDEVIQESIVKGDEKSISIAAGSIVAKVTRDRMMKEYDVLFPEYQFAKNKGYGTKEHVEAIRKYGPCPIHRTSFIKNFVN